MIDLTPILQAVIAILATIITVYVIPFIKSKINKEKQVDIEAWINIAVLAAEQLFPGTKQGNNKKDYVISFLIEHGFLVDAEKIDSAVNVLIEAAVYELKN